MKPLSFIIISYNRPADLLELLNNISQLDKAQELLEEIIIVNNASTENYDPVKSFIKEQDTLPFRYYDAPENLGVARGRNFALQQGKAPIMIMIDDDTVLQNKDCLVNLETEFRQGNSKRATAIVSFKVLYYDNLQMQKNAFPHKHFDEYKDKAFFETYYYVGCGHAINRKVIAELGAYPEDFFYGMEEYDLAYRVLDAGYGIVYSDKVVVLHKESPLGRKPKKEKLQMMWVNKSKVAWRYLPGRYFYSTAIMWSLQYLNETGFNLKGFVSGWRKVFAIPSKEKRSSIKKETLNYLGSVKARLWY